MSDFTKSTDFSIDTLEHPPCVLHKTAACAEKGAISTAKTIKIKHTTLMKLFYICYIYLSSYKAKDLFWSCVSQPDFSINRSSSRAVEQNLQL